MKKIIANNVIQSTTLGFGGMAGSRVTKLNDDKIDAYLAHWEEEFFIREFLF
jgi:hypothetical protein